MSVYCPKNRKGKATDSVLYVESTETVDLTGLGVSGSPLEANVNVDPAAGNLLRATASGLYVPPVDPDLLSSVTAESTETVQLTGAGTAASPLRAEVPHFRVSHFSTAEAAAVINSEGATAAGPAALAENAENAVAIGAIAQATASDAIAIGYQAKAVKRGAIAHGDNARAEGIDSIAIGQDVKAEEGSGNICIGTLTAARGTGSSNVVIGARAEAGSGSSGSVVIGERAKLIGAGVSAQVAIGSNAQVNSATGSNVALGAGSSVEAEDKVNDRDVVSVGKRAVSATPQYKRRIINVEDALEATDAATLNQVTEGFKNAQEAYVGARGQGTSQWLQLRSTPTMFGLYNATLNSWVQPFTSTRAVKKNIKTYTGGLSAVTQVRSTRFKYKKESEDDSPQIGFIAEEVQELVPEAVVLDAEGKVVSFKYYTMLAVLWGAVRELSAELEELKSKVK